MRECEYPTCTRIITFLMPWFVSYSYISWDCSFDTFLHHILAIFFYNFLRVS